MARSSTLTQAELRAAFKLLLSVEWTAPSWEHSVCEWHDPLYGFGDNGQKYNPCGGLADLTVEGSFKESVIISSLNDNYAWPRFVCNKHFQKMKRFIRRAGRPGDPTRREWVQALTALSYSFEVSGCEDVRDFVVQNRGAIDRIIIRDANHTERWETA